MRQNVVTLNLRSNILMNGGAWKRENTRNVNECRQIHDMQNIRRFD